jgi:hypothetical protein
LLSYRVARLLDCLGVNRQEEASVTVVQSSPETREQPEHPGYELAYQEALRGLAQQQAALESVRTRAATLLAAASVVRCSLVS